MDLSKVVTGQKIKPPRVCLYGQEKIGKTTFAAGAPAPIFIQTEDGADEVGAARFPKSKSFDDAIGCIRTLAKEPHDYKTVVIDSGDWLERLIFDAVVEENNEQPDKKKIKDIEGIGYGKGFIAALVHWKKILNGLDYLREERGMSSIIICHADVKRFDSPETEPYDRYTLKTHKTAAALLCEWADVIGFACLETVVRSTDVGFNKEVRRGVTTGRRTLKLEGSPAFVAGNRYGLPASIPLDWESFVSSFNRKPQAA